MFTCRLICLLSFCLFFALVVIGIVKVVKILALPLVILGVMTLGTIILVQVGRGK